MISVRLFITILLCAFLAFAQNVYPRSNLYFGTRSASKYPTMTGFAWAPMRSDSSELLLRHSCRNEHDLQKWGWQAFDASDYGYQFISDNLASLVSIGRSISWRFWEIQ